MKKLWRTGFAILLCSVLMLPTFILRIHAIVDFSDTTSEHTKLTGLKGNFEELSNGYRINKINGDNQNISDLRASEFALESDVTFLEGNNATFIFGAEKHASENDLGKFFGIELSRTNDNNDIRIKLFQNPLGVGLGDNVIPTTVVTTVSDKNAAINFKVSVDKNNNLEVYINNIKADLRMEKDFKNHYIGGYFGFLTWNTNAKFDNFKLTTVNEQPLNFNTNLDQLKGLQGTWGITSKGLYSAGNGDNFAMSNSAINNFEYRANITNKNKQGAGALVFRSADNPKDGSYVMNIDYSNKIFKLFSFPTGGTIKEVPLSTIEPNTDGSYDLKVQAVDDTIRVFVNNIGIVNMKNSLYSSGKLGLLTWDGAVSYQNVNFDSLDALETIAQPQLSDFKIKTPGVTITPNFDPNVSIYGMDITPGIDNVVIEPSANGTMYVTKRDENGTLIKDKTKINGTFTISKDEFVEDFMNVDITVVTNEGFTNTINFAVNRWLSNEELAKEEYRSQFHVTPQSNFMNDPNGMVYDSTDGYWHLFYQYSTKNNFYNQSWAHVRSKDLVNWEQQPLGIQIDDYGLIFSGSAVEDKDNTSGLFTGNDANDSKLVALYTYHNPKDGKQSQALAYSKDHGVTWNKYGTVIPNSDTLSGNDFRDPKVFKIDGDTRWYMVTAGGAAQIHVSDDLIHWTKSQPLLYKNGDQIHSECPMLYPAKVNGTQETKWVYGGSAGFYVVGNMQKDPATGIFKWSAESEKLDVDSNENPWGGFGKYATMTFFEDGTNKNRQIGISWLQDFVDFSGRHYRGAQSLPQEYGLRQIDGQYVITCNPVEEVNLLRDQNNILYKTSNKNIVNKNDNILKGISGLRYDIEAEFTIGTATEFGFKLRKGNGQEIIYKYNVTNKKMYLDVSNAGPHQNSGNYNFELLPSDTNKVKLRILVDQGAVEAFGNDGEANISTIAYMSNKNIGMEFFNDGTLTVNTMKIYDMKSMYSKKSGSESEQTQLYLDAPTYAALNETFEVNANIYPNKASAGVNWNVDKELAVVSKDETSITLKATKEGNFKITASSKDGAYQTSTNVRVAKPAFNNNATNWETISGNWTIDDFGMNANNLGNDDSFYVSQAKIERDKPFSIEGTIQLKEGQAAGIAFGIKDKTNPQSYWYCANIDTVSEGGIAKMFKNTNGQAWAVSKKLSEIRTSRVPNAPYQLEINYDGNGTLSYYLNGTLVGEQNDPTFEGGYIGIQTFKANAIFQDIYIHAAGTIVEVSESVKDVKVLVNTSIENIQNNLPKTIKAKQDNNILVDADIIWDLTNFTTKDVGTYTIEGSVKDTPLKVSTNIIVVADKSALVELLNKIKGMNFDNYTFKSVQALLSEVQKVEALINDDTITQESVNTSIQNLNTLLSKLVKVENPSNEPSDTNKNPDSTLGENKGTTTKVNTSDTTNANFYLLISMSALLIITMNVAKRKRKQHS